MSHVLYDWNGRELMRVQYDSGRLRRHNWPADDPIPEKRCYHLAELLEARIRRSLPLAEGFDLDAIIKLNEPYLNYLKDPPETWADPKRNRDG
jgi:hypothetical protein